MTPRRLSAFQHYVLGAMVAFGLALLLYFAFAYFQHILEWLRSIPLRC